VKVHGRGTATEASAIKWYKLNQVKLEEKNLYIIYMNFLSNGGERLAEIFFSKEEKACSIVKNDRYSLLCL
jgi:hypothetical protein